MEPIPTVLVVDDDSYILGAISALCVRLPFHGLYGENPTDALNTSQQAGLKLDLLICDIHLGGGINGVELAARIRRRHPRVKVIYMSGDPKAELLIADQTVPLLRKPFTLKDLEIGIRTALAESARTGVTNPRCPNCSSVHIRRSRPRIHDWILLPIIVPYHCPDCRIQFHQFRANWRPYFSRRLSQ